MISLLFLPFKYILHVTQYYRKTSINQYIFSHYIFHVDIKQVFAHFPVRVYIKITPTFKFANT